MVSVIIHLLSSLLFWIIWLPTNNAFISTGFSCGTKSFYNAKNNNDPGEESPFNADIARQRLESLLGDSETNSEKNNISLLQLLESNDFLSALPPPPPLSAIERDRRTAEILMLERLEDGDESLADLWSLWYSERGSTAQSILKETDELLGDPNTWRDCETKLLQLTNDYGIYFVEPVNRLATLYFLQGKFQESYKLCQIILKLKPWHFGALSGIVQVCIRNDDLNAARAWAGKGLPAMQSTGNYRRTEWVENAVTAAKKMMKQAEKTTQTNLGKPEEYYGKPANSNDNQNLDRNDETDAWQ